MNILMSVKIRKKSVGDIKKVPGGVKLVYPFCRCHNQLDNVEKVYFIS